MEPKEGQVRKSQVGLAERVKPKSREPPPEGGLERLRPPPRSHSQMVTEQDWNGPLAKSLSEAWFKDRLHLGQVPDPVQCSWELSSSQAAPNSLAPDGEELGTGSRVHSIRPLNKVRSKELFH